MLSYLLYIVLGLAVGVFSGVVGVGGGLLMIPVMVLLLGFSQHQAQGTTLAMMVPPIGIAAAWVYYKQGFVDIKVAAICAIGFIVGGFFGAKIATSMPDVMLKKVFGVVLLALSIKMIVSR